jgi:peptidoglycan/xylan/chitin deacetylase (PgdA/CDA1 family)
VTPAPAPSPQPAAPASLLGTDWTRIPTGARVVALTFDAGANADALPSILATLDSTGTPATFFLTGAWIRAHPALARTLADRGSVLGNHTDTHPHLPQLTDAQIAAELAAAESALASATGRRFDRVFRFPYGDRTAADIAVVNALGYVCVRWTVDTLGWKGTSGGITADAVVDRVLAAATPGEIVLMHVGSNPTDGSTLDADALPRVIAGLRDRGYGFTTLATMAP